jgi:hypothetical protein
MVWMAGSRARFGLHDAVSALLCGLIYYAGNLQSHTYLPIFAFAFLFGIFWKDRTRIWRAIGVVTFGGIVGALLATPVLANQLEFFLVGERAATPDANPFARLLALPFSLLAVHPWAAGTFRSLDVGKLFGIGGTAFLLFCGGAALIVALVAVPKLLKKPGEHGAAAATSLICLLVFFVIIASPLAKILYPRIAGMAGMAVVVLAGLGLREMSQRPLLPGLLGKRLALLHAGWVVAASVVVLLAFPKFKVRIVEKIAETGERNAGGLGNREQRLAQVERLPKEVTLLNPQAVVGLSSGVLALLALGRAGSNRSRDNLVLVSLGLGLLATASFHHRFRPLHDRTLWNNLAAGGQPQKNGIAIAAGGLRLDESKLPLEEQVFPHAWAAFHRVHVVQGYSALQPRCLQWYPADQPAIQPDWRADFTGDGHGGFEKTEGTSPSRFRNPVTGHGEPFQIPRQTNNRIELQLAAGSSSKGFILTDTRYPGWRAGHDMTKPEPEGYTFTRWATDLRGGETIILSYVPTTRFMWLPGFAVGLVTLLFATTRGFPFAANKAEVNCPNKLSPTDA